ncbi:hypothetical protein [Wolbachia endosymbiont (group E) of Neria commutata]|uniref:hypothetical protein n=1 Tax=Wolbachia endosymbiont (group E) of Neria commutata TaxID=3066149 RepID=UPI003132DCE9
MTTSTHKELIDILNEISGGKINEISDKQTQALIDVCALLSQRLRGIVPPPPPPPLPSLGMQFSLNGFNKPMGDALALQLGNLKKTTKNEKTTEAKKLPNAIKRNKDQDLLTQELEKAIKRKTSKAEGKGSKKQKATTVSEIHDPSLLSIKDRFALWKKR